MNYLQHLKKAFIRIMLPVCLLASLATTAQQRSSAGLVYTAKVIFHGYSLPFKKAADNFANLGFGFSVDYPYNKSATALQSLGVGLLRHKEHGNLYYVNTQFSYRPLVFNALEPGISIGIGRSSSFTNRDNRFYSVNDGGGWAKSKSQRQGHWQIPVGISLGYRVKAFNQVALTPNIGYEVAALLKYNSAFPVLPYSSFTAGIRVAHLQKSSK